MGLGTLAALKYDAIQDLEQYATRGRAVCGTSTRARKLCARERDRSFRMMEILDLSGGSISVHRTLQVDGAKRQHVADFRRPPCAHRVGRLLKIACRSILRSFAEFTDRYVFAGQCRSRNQTRYSDDIFARCPCGARRRHVDASSLFSGAAHRSSAQSFGL
jgi:hypothetical protein